MGRRSKFRRAIFFRVLPLSWLRLPRRKQLLEMLRIPFGSFHRRGRARPPWRKAGGVCDALSRAKAQAVVRAAPAEVVLAADTTVVLGGRSSRSRRRHETRSTCSSSSRERRTKCSPPSLVAENGRLEQALDVSRVTFGRRPPHTGGVRGDGEPSIRQARTRSGLGRR